MVAGLDGDGDGGEGASALGGAGGALGWMATEWVHRKRPSTFGLLSGCIAGLVAITPACGFVGPAGAIAVGFLTAPVCLYAVESVKRRFGYDDSFDVFGVHGVGGILGAILTGVFCAKGLGGIEPDGYNMAHQVWVQLKSVLLTIVWSGVVSLVAYKIASLTVGLRVSEESERQGLDITSHGEVAYTR